MPRLSISAARGPVITVNGRELVSFGGCNYLGLSWHANVRSALERGLKDFGVSTSASRETTGNTTEHDNLEAALRAFLGVEGAVLLPDGYTANLAAAQALAQSHRVALIDSRSHRSIRESIAASGLLLHEYRHRDADDAAAQVSRLKSLGPVLVWTDGIFAADGAAAPLPELLDACRASGATMVIDDCHGFAALGPGGRGTLSHFGLEHPERVVITTTLAKGLGCHGGVVAGSGELAQTITSRSSAYICTTPVSPAIAAAATAALRVLEEEPERIQRLRDNAARLAEVLRSAGLNTGSAGPAPIFAFTLSSRAQMDSLHQHLLHAGYLAPLIEYPDGPAPAYFRLSISSEHTPLQIKGLAAALSGFDSGPRPRTVAQTAG